MIASGPDPVGMVRLPLPLSYLAAQEKAGGAETTKTVNPKKKPQIPQRCVGFRVGGDEPLGMIWA
jgi:hypothetical protein